MQINHGKDHKNVYHFYSQLSNEVIAQYAYALSLGLLEILLWKGHCSAKIRLMIWDPSFFTFLH